MVVGKQRDALESVGCLQSHTAQTEPEQEHQERGMGMFVTVRRVQMSRDVRQGREKKQDPGRMYQVWSR